MTARGTDRRAGTARRRKPSGWHGHVLMAVGFALERRKAFVQDDPSCTNAFSFESQRRCVYCRRHTRGLAYAQDVMPSRTQAIIAGTLIAISTMLAAAPPATLPSSLPATRPLDQ